MDTENSIDRLVSRLRHAPPTSPAGACSLLEQADLSAQDLTAWSDFRHCPGDSYGRKLIAEAPGFEMLVMSWCPGDASAIHDHGKAEWGAVRVFGPAEHAVFRVRGRNPPVMQTAAVGSLSDGTILEVAPDLIHQMCNPTERSFLSLHLYGRQGGEGPVTGDARVFDLLDERVIRTDGGVFFALPPHCLTEPGVRGDAETRRRHHRQLDHRLRKMRRAGLWRPDLDAVAHRLADARRESAA